MTATSAKRAPSAVVRRSRAIGFGADDGAPQGQCLIAIGRVQSPTRVAGALGALLALVAVIAVVLAGYDPPPSLPTSVDSGRNGYLALREWLDESGIATASHRRQWDVLEEYGNGNLLVVTTPQRQRLRRGEAANVGQWVADGNALLLMAALNDTPDWALAAPALHSFEDDLEALAALRFEARQVDGEPLEVGAEGEEVRLEMDAVEAHPLAAGVSTLAGFTDGPASVWQVAAAHEDLRLRVAVDRQHGTDAFWHIPLGRGHVFVSALGSPFTNRAIAEADNAILFANLVRHHLGPGKAVIFDDVHQGLSALYGPVDFYRDPRLHVSIAFVLALWFLYMVGTWNRLAPVREAPEDPGQQDFVRAVGGFLARKLTPVDTGRMMFASWFSALTGRPTPFEQPPWGRLEDNPLADEAQLTALKEAHARLRAGRKVPLRQLHNRIRQLRTAIGGVS